jgi:hypothetical protein
MLARERDHFEIAKMMIEPGASPAGRRFFSIETRADVLASTWLVKEGILTW